MTRGPSCRLPPFCTQWVSASWDIVHKLDQYVHMFRVLPSVLLELYLKVVLRVHKTIEEWEPELLSPSFIQPGGCALTTARVEGHNLLWAVTTAHLHSDS